MKNELIEIASKIENNELDELEAKQKLKELLGISNCYVLTDGQKEQMKNHKSNTVKFSHSSGIGVSVEIRTSKGEWLDVTDYGSW